MKSATKFIRITPKKINLIADMVRGKDVVTALAFLKHTPKKAAGIIFKSLTSAVANAVNNMKQSAENLYVSHINGTEGPRLKRHIPVSRGRAHPIIKRSSHLYIELKVKEAVAAKPEKKEATKEGETTETTPKKAKRTVSAKKTKPVTT